MLVLTTQCSLNTAQFSVHSTHYTTLITGKSITAQAIATASGATVISMSGAEILSKGNMAGSSMRLLLDTAKKNEKAQVVVILDDADTIIKSRGVIKSDTATAVHSCFYLLLEAIRESNIGMSLIITASSDIIENIDAALIDR